MNDCDTGEWVRKMRLSAPVRFNNDPQHPYIIIVDGEIAQFCSNFKEAELESRKYRYNPNVLDVLICQTVMHNEVLYGTT